LIHEPRHPYLDDRWSDDRARAHLKDFSSALAKNGTTIFLSTTASASQKNLSRIGIIQKAGSSLGHMSEPDRQPRESRHLESVFLDLTPNKRTTTATTILSLSSSHYCFPHSGSLENCYRGAGSAPAACDRRACRLFLDRYLVSPDVLRYFERL